jgi:hypothetical protein
MRDLTPLCYLARKHETDKGGRHYRYGGGDSDTCHEYTPVYWDLMSGQKDQVKAILEIGVNAGSSLRMWEEFFPNAQIIGIDCRPEVLFNEGRIRCFLADQNNPMQLRLVLQKAGIKEYDMIIDDGSHELGHQIVSMDTLLPFVKDGGFYVVEDMYDDCHPEVLGKHVAPGYQWAGVPTDMGIGKAHCPCPECGGTGVERLLVVQGGKGSLKLVV